MSSTAADNISLCQRERDDPFWSHILLVGEDPCETFLTRTGEHLPILYETQVKCSAKRWGDSFRTKLLAMPNNSKLRSKAWQRRLLMSFATKRPFPCKNSPRSCTFYRREPHKSNTQSPVEDKALLPVPWRWALEYKKTPPW